MSAEEVSKIIGCENIAQLMKHIVDAQSLATFGRSGNYSCAIGDVPFFVKIALYYLFVHDLWEVPEAPARMIVDVEIDVMRAIKERIIDKGYTPHFAEILYVSKCDNISKFIRDLPKCDEQLAGHVRGDNYPQSLLCSFTDLVRGKNALDKFALIFSESCEFHIKEFIVRYSPVFPSVRDIMIQAIMFQVYYTLEVATRVWSKFRHGDLLPHNIMVKLAHHGEKYLEPRRYLRYELDHNVWNVPFFGFFVKIIDFGHSSIPNEGIESSIKRAGDLWVPDRVAFTVHFSALIEEAQFMSEKLRSLFKAIDTQLLTPNVSQYRLVEASAKFRSTYSILQQFLLFETAVDEKDVLHKYRGPPARSERDV
jgi:hypothetical protein